MDEKNLTQQTPPETALTAPSPAYAPTMWNDSKLLAQAYKAAQYLAGSDLVPEQTYKNKPQNCLIALDMANRMNIAPLLIMQNLYIIKGKPAWSGQFCISVVNGCGRFTPLEFINLPEGGCYAQAVDVRTGKLCVGTAITWEMVKGEDWLNKSGSKWKTMPEQMFTYRAASFFARKYCPDLLMGLQTVEEVRDVSGYEEQEKPVVEIVLD